MSGLTCPNCEKWTADSEMLPEQQDWYRPIRCPKCEKVFAIKWEVKHEARKLGDLPSYVTSDPDFLQEIADA